MAGVHKKTTYRKSSDVTDKKRTCTVDRFIPRRVRVNFDLSHEALIKDLPHVDLFCDVHPSSLRGYDRALSSALFGGSEKSKGVLHFHESNDIQQKIIVKSSDKRSRNKLLRLPSKPELMLDLPGLMHSCTTLNLLAWGAGGLLTAGLGNAVWIWHLDQDAPHLAVDLKSAICSAVAWNDTGRYITVASQDNYMAIWDVKTWKNIGELLASCTQHELCFPTSIVWIPSTLIFYSGCSEGALDAVNTNLMGEESIEPIAIAHDGAITHIEITTCRRYLVTTGEDRVVRIWRFSGDQWWPPKRLHIQHEIKDSVTTRTISLHPNRCVIAMASQMWDGRIEIWNIQTKNFIAQEETNSMVLNVKWHPRNGELVSSHCRKISPDTPDETDNDILIWRLPADNFVHPATSELILIGRISGLEAKVFHLLWSPDTKFLATAAANETLSLWNLSPKSPKRPKNTRKSKLDLFCIR